MGKAARQLVGALKGRPLRQGRHRSEIRCVRRVHPCAVFRYSPLVALKRWMLCADGRENLCSARIQQLGQFLRNGIAALEHFDQIGVTV